MDVLMVASENDAVPGAKVGGIADVVRDLPRALARRGCRVSVVIPSYGVLHRARDASRVCELDVDFRRDRHRLSLWELAAAGAGSPVRQLALHGAAFAPATPGQVYCDDPPQRPFATDASKFALFSAGVCAAACRGAFGDVDVLHLHDWHAALVLLLRAYDPACAALKRVRCVLTIHNLALQGVRPLRGDPSALESWFPKLRYDPAAVADPRWRDCVNPMAVGIRLADAVSTVSPTYAREILRPNAIEQAGFHGGEGLEADLQTVHEAGRLHGILNGCEYPDPPARDSLGWPGFVELLRGETLRLAAAEERLASAHYIALTRLFALRGKPPEVLVTSVGRVVEQKLGLLRTPHAGGGSVLEALLRELGEGGLYVMVGSGDAGLERFLREVAAAHPNFVFVRGFAASLAPALYEHGDLFLMPSSYEPCGISQMLAMRAGQPCLVHAVGGLRDTVRDRIDGFSFNGGSRPQQAEALVRAFAGAVALHRDEPDRWQGIREAAAAARFRWDDSAATYLERLYQAP